MPFVRSFVRSFVRASHEIAREVTDDGPETETRWNEPTEREREREREREINNVKKRESDRGTRNEEPSQRLR